MGLNIHHEWAFLATCSRWRLAFRDETAESTFAAKDVMEKKIQKTGGDRIVDELFPSVFVVYILFFRQIQPCKI